MVGNFKGCELTIISTTGSIANISWVPTMGQTGKEIEEQEVA